MSRIIYCLKKKKNLEGIAAQPYPGELGEKIFKNISQAAWEEWQAHQTMLINEYRLNMLEPDARKFLKTEMEKFLFGEGSEKPQGYIPPKNEQ